MINPKFKESSGSTD